MSPSTSSQAALKPAAVRSLLGELARNVAERAVTLVVVQHVGEVADVGDDLLLGRPLPSALHVVGHVEVEHPVAVEVAPRGAHPATVVAADTGRGADVLELTGAVIAQQQVGAVTDQCKIGIAVVVVVGEGGAVGASGGDAPLGTSLRERCRRPGS